MSMPNPIVLLDARARYVHPAFQMTRASTKTVFDSAGRLVTVPANALGWDHDPATGQARGYLAEPSATNLLLHSNDLTQSWSVVNATTDPGAIIGPDGSGMAKLIEDNQNTEHFVSQNVTISEGDPVSFQAIARADERNHVVLQIADPNNFNNTARVHFALSPGGVSNEVVTGDAALLGRGIRHIGNGFYLCWISGTLDEATACQSRVWLWGSGSRFYQGDGTSGLHLGYLQTETATHPTSYIETGAATATRAGDNLVLSDLGDFPWWRSERGTLLVDVEPPNNPHDQGRFLFNISNSIRLSISGIGLLHVYGSHLSDNINIRNVVNNPLERCVVSVAWDNNEVVCAMNGDVVRTVAAAGSALSATALALGNSIPTGSPLDGHIRRAVYYPQRISNADLQSLTAIQE